VSPDGGATPTLALTLAQNLVATFYGAVNMPSTLSVTGAATFGSTILASGDVQCGNAGTSNRNFVIKANAGYFAMMRIGGPSTDLRWILGKNGDAESGSNAGSAFFISAYTDLGVFIDYPVTCARAAGGTWTFNRPVTLGGTNALAVGGDFSFNGNGTFGNASTDTITCTGRLLVRSVTDAGPMTATGGTQREVVFNTSNSKYYGCTVTHATAATWAALN